MEVDERMWHLVKGELHFPLWGAGGKKAAERHGRSLKIISSIYEEGTVPRLHFSIFDMKQITLTLQRSEHQIHTASIQHGAGA